VKRKNLNEKATSRRRDRKVFQNEKHIPTPPAVFVRMANTGVTAYGTWKGIRRTGFRSGRGMEKTGRRECRATITGKDSMEVRFG